MDILFIRHAESTNNRAWALAPGTAERVPDPGLTDLGVAQAQALADWLPGFTPRPTHFFASPFRRTLLTAAPLAEALDMSVTVKTELMERSGPYIGDFAEQRWHPGSPVSELAAISPRFTFPPEATEAGWWQGPFEDRDQACARAESLVRWLREGFEADACIILVSHGAIGSLFSTALFCPDELSRHSAQVVGETSSWFVLDNSSVSWFRLYGQDTELRAFNRVDHLVKAGLTSATQLQPS